MSKQGNLCQRNHSINRVILSALCIVWATAYSTPANVMKQPPNILWIMLDDLRADALSCYGTPWAQTPNMDQIAARGVRFKNAYTQSVICTPSRLSILTGHYCHTLKEMEMGAKPEIPADYLPLAAPPLEQQIDLPSVLSKLDMSPVNVGKTHWSERWDMIPIEEPPRADHARIDPALRVYDLVRLVSPQPFPPEHGRVSRRWTIGGGNPLLFDEIKPKIIVDAALDVLKKRDPAKPFFLRMSFSAPHIPILTPPDFMAPLDSIDIPNPTAEELSTKPYFERLQLAQYGSVLHLNEEELLVARGSYYGLVSFVDYQIGRVIEHLKAHNLLQNTLIVINSDHGIQLGEHGLYKKRNFYEQTVAVPLIFSWPGKLPQGMVIDELVEMIDFLPTVMDLVSIETPAEIPGRSMMPLIRGEVDSWREVVFSELDHSMSPYTALRVYSGRRIMVRSKQWKMIYFRDARVPSEDGALYDMVGDSGETKNLYNDAEYAEVVSMMKNRVSDWSEGKQFNPQSRP